MTVRVLLFGPLAAAIGRSSVEVRLNADCTCAALKQTIGSNWAQLRPMVGPCRVALNQKFAADTDQVGASDEVALIGMVSGG